MTRTDPRSEFKRATQATTMKKLKLSQIWEKADQELAQVFCQMGNRLYKQACALGAILYYATTSPLTFMTFTRLDQAYLDDIKSFQIHFGREIISLNDRHGWTFSKFAQKARDIGL